MPPFSSLSGAAVSPPQSRFALAILPGVLAGLVFILTGAIAWLALSSNPISPSTILWLVAVSAAIGVCSILQAVRARRAINSLEHIAEKNLHDLNVTLPQLRALWEQCPMSHHTARSQ